MLRFDIDITPEIDGKECHLEGFCEMISSNTFRTTMTSPFKGLSVTKTYGENEQLYMDSTFAQVELDLITLYLGEMMKFH